MDRRRFIAAIAGSLIAAPLATKAQQVPKVRRIGVLTAGKSDPANQYWDLVRKDYEQAFRSLGMQPIFVEVTGPAELEKAIAEIARQRAQEAPGSLTSRHQQAYVLMHADNPDSRQGRSRRDRAVAQDS